MSELSCIAENKYYNADEGRFLRREDGCPLRDWRTCGDSFKFAMHPRGFLVFLHSSQLEKRDEYDGHDPYGVFNESGSVGAFHERRFTGTISLVQEALRHAPGRSRILDVGCGRGHITAEILKRFPFAEVSGLDCSISAIAAASERYKGIDFVVADAYRPPYAPEYFDIVVCNNIWEHVPDPLRLLESLNRILTAEGYLIISTPSRYRLGNLARILMGKPVKFISPHHVTEYTVGQVIEQLRFGGFEAKAYSSRLRVPINDLTDLILRKVWGPLVRAYLWVIASHHSLEWTVFYLARKMSLPTGAVEMHKTAAFTSVC